MFSKKVKSNKKLLMHETLNYVL